MEEADGSTVLALKKMESGQQCMTIEEIHTMTLESTACDSCTKWPYASHILPEEGMTRRPGHAFLGVFGARWGRLTNYEDDTVVSEYYVFESDANIAWTYRIRIESSRFERWFGPVQRTRRGCELEPGQSARTWT